ncbi:MAG: DNA mismatch repair protein MutS [Candidatus Woesearchaeota archaeon]
MKLTPAMRQFMEVKEQYPDALILFRMGDFYECFYDDAIFVSKTLGIALTSRGKDQAKAPLAGIPYHALEKYLKGLVATGRKVAICEQIEDPKQAKGIVKRAVTRVVTAGTLVENALLDDKTNNFIACVFEDNGQFGLSYCDISTGEFSSKECKSSQDFFDELARISPSELLVCSSQKQLFENYAQTQKIACNTVGLEQFIYERAKERLESQFSQTLVELQLHQYDLAVCSAGALLWYLNQTQKTQLSYLRYASDTPLQTMQLDETTIRNLELLKTAYDQDKQGSLLSVIDKTKTNMGARLLRQWIVRPLAQTHTILERQNAVEQLSFQTITLEDTRDILSQMSDIERIASKIGYGNANPRDLVTLKDSLTLLAQIQQLLSDDQIHSQYISKLIDFADNHKIIEQIDKTLKDECPLSVREGNFIKRGFHSQLDSYWDIKENAQKYLLNLEKSEIEKTKISTLKVKYNKVFGYFIEITKRFSDSVPSHYQRKQSTVNAERFITDELKELEVKILSAEEKIRDLEYTLFLDLCSFIQKNITIIQDISKQIAQIDCLSSFARVSLDNNYTKPSITNDYALHLEQSRHPVIELQEHQFIPNDLRLDEQEHMMIITGPNMAGKSTFMRQCALTIILAQMGCFVPANKATIGIVDKLFTRVGSHDNLARGQSTFMVEMTQTAYILSNATKKSFIILDEIGSGTSTYDGVAIAWAVAQELATNQKSKTLFSTHYHVLTKLDSLQGVVNYNVAVEEKDDHITFLRKIERGGTDKSYGLHVASLAGVPARVVENAKKVQLKLEADDAMNDKIIVEKLEKKFAKLKQQTLLDIHGNNT